MLPLVLGDFTPYIILHLKVLKRTSASDFFHYCFRLYLTLMRTGVALQAGLTGFESMQGREVLLVPKMSRPDLGPTQPPIKWVDSS